MNSMSLQIAELRPPLLRFALKLTRNEADAEDLAHAAIIKAIEHQHQYSPGNLLSWVSTILFRTFLADKRRQHTWRMVEDPEGSYTAALAASDDIAAAFEARQYFALIGRLPAAHQRALWQVFDGVTLQDMARSEGVAIGTIKSRVHRARAGLAELAGGAA